MTKHAFQIVLDRPQGFTLSLEPWALSFEIPARTEARVEIQLDSESEWTAGVAEEDDGRSVIGFMFPMFRVKVGNGDWQDFDYS